MVCCPCYNSFSNLPLGFAWACLWWEQWRWVNHSSTMQCVETHGLDSVGDLEYLYFEVPFFDKTAYSVLDTVSDSLSNDASVTSSEKGASIRSIPEKFITLISYSYSKWIWAQFINSLLFILNFPQWIFPMLSHTFLDANFWYKTCQKLASKHYET